MILVLIKIIFEGPRHASKHKCVRYLCADWLKDVKMQSDWRSKILAVNSCSIGDIIAVFNLF